MSLEIKNLRVQFRTDGRQWATAVKDVSLVVPQGRTVALVGESGSGKSVTALSVLGLLPRAQARLGPQSQILWHGQDLLESSQTAWRQVRGTEISMVFQEPMSSLNPVFSVGYQIMEGLRLHRGLNSQAARQRAVQLLQEVGIDDAARRLDSYPHQLSGGQQQRVMIAMAISCEPQLLIADEPTTALDVTIGRQIMDLLLQLQKSRRMSLLFITHDLALVREIADEVVVMKDGEVREAAATEALFNHPRDVYTRALLACRPPSQGRPRHLPTIDQFMQGGHPAPQSERQRGQVISTPPLLSVRGLQKTYWLPDGVFRKKPFMALKGASFELQEGRTLGIVGESGSGKSTLGLALMSLLPRDGGRIQFDGRDISDADALARDPTLRRQIQIVFQNPYASLNPRFTVGDILMEPLRLHGLCGDETGRHHEVRALIEKVGLPADTIHRYPHEFSGGQRQRVAIARCLALRPRILICDESVSALDVSVQAQVLNLLQDLQEEYRMSYIFISHDLSVVRYMSDEVMVMQQGEVVEQGNADQVFSRPRHPYTQRLLAAIPGQSRRV
jgi:peptide/nickel transport system ATP-binding protein